ncbi:MAG: CPXCG motif-containing cysteine-rich protein [Gammaproteobacteria bacterium]
MRRDPAPQGSVLSALISEAEITCPHCGETITVVLDLSVPAQSYVEDCFVCCRPISISYTADGGELLAVMADAEC